MLSAFRHALAGIAYAVRHERNMRIHLCFTAYVILFGALAGLEAWAWAACLICIGMVTGLELANTALERLCDKVCPERDELIRVCKDAAAGGVLAAAILAAVVGCVVFCRAEVLERMWARVCAYPWMAVVSVALLAPCVFFIVGNRKDVKEEKWKSKGSASSR